MKKYLAMALVVASPNLFAAQSVFNGSELQAVSKYDQEAYRGAEGTHTKYGILIIEGRLSKSNRQVIEQGGLTIEGVMGLTDTHSHLVVSSKTSLGNHVSRLSSDLPNFYNVINYKRPSIVVSESNDAQSFSVELFNSVGQQGAEGIFNDIGVSYNHINDSLFVVDLTSSQLTSLLQYDEIKAVEEFVTPVVTNTHARQITKVDDAQQDITFEAYFPPDNDWLDGEKYTGNHIDVGIYDTGIDTNHFDFREIVLDAGGSPIPGTGPDYYDNKLTAPRLMDCLNGATQNATCDSFYEYAPQNYPSAPWHGTHVAGIAGGNGWNSSNIALDDYELRGVAPKVDFWSRRFSGSGPYDNYEVGHVTNHSHTITSSGYNSRSKSIDKALRDQQFVDNRRKTIVYAAANQNYAKGYYSLAADSKNAVIVGNANKHTGKLYQASSLGPTLDGRIKPDVIAPGAADGSTEPSAQSPTKVYVDQVSIRRAGSSTPYIDYNFAQSQQGWKSGSWSGMQNAAEVDGALYLEKTRGLSYTLSPEYASPHSAQANDQLTLTYKIELGENHEPYSKMAGALFWYTGSGEQNPRYLGVELDVTGEFETLSVNLSDILHSASGHVWTPGDAIHGIRLDFNRCSSCNGVISTINGNNYGGSTGTSMAAPHVAGIIALMTEKYGHEVLACPLGEDCSDLDEHGPRSSLTRALLIHTATDLENDELDQALINPDLTDSEYTIYGKGPDFSTGWGLVNAKKALDYVKDEKISRAIVNDTEEEVFHFRVEKNAGPFRITATWDDIESAITVSGSTTPRLLNDVDMHVIAPDGTVFYPWVLEPFVNGPVQVADIKPATNTCATDFAHACYDHLNNVEVIDVNNPQHGDWTLVIKGRTILEDQEVSLVSDYELKSNEPKCWDVTGWSSSNLHDAQALLEAASCETIPLDKIYSRRFTDDNYLRFATDDSRIIPNGPFNTRLVFYGYDANSGKPIIKTKQLSCIDCNNNETLYRFPPKQANVGVDDIFRLRDPDTSLCLYGGTQNGTVIRGNLCNTGTAQLFTKYDLGNDIFRLKGTIANQCLYAHSANNAYTKSWGCYNGDGFRWREATEGLGFRLEHLNTDQCIKGGAGPLAPAPHYSCSDNPELQYQLDLVERAQQCDDYGIEDNGNGQLTYYYRDLGWAANGFTTKMCLDTAENCYDATKSGDFYVYTTPANYGVGDTGSVKIKVSDDTPPGQFISELHSVTVVENGTCIYAD